MIDLQIINDFDNKLKLSNDLIEKVISDIIFNESEYNNIKISVIISDDEYLRSLKIKYFNMDIFTDVITFNLSDDDKNLDAEIYISWERVSENTRKYKQEINDEMKRVIIHGCLHLVGFNDSTEKEKIYMREKEQEYINSLGEDIII